MIYATVLITLYIIAPLLEKVMPHLQNLFCDVQDRLERGYSRHGGGGDDDNDDNNDHGGNYQNLNEEI